MTVGNFFKRVIVPVRQRPISADLNQLQERLLEATRLVAMSNYATNAVILTSGNPDNRSSIVAPHGFMGGGFRVVPDPAATPFGIMLQPGVGYSAVSPATVTNYESANGLDYDASNNWAPFVLSAYQTGLTVTAPPAVGSSRIDRIEIKSDYRATEPATVGIFNTATEVFDPATRNKSFTWDLLGRTGAVTAPAASTAKISYKTGVAAVGAISAATPAPATSGYTTIALINVTGADTAISQDMIVDYRRPILPGGVLRVGGRATIPGIAAGIGTEDFSYQDVPPGVFMKMAFQNNVAPSAGTSYTARFYVIGAIDPLFNAAFGSLVASTMESAPRCTVVSASATSMGTSDVEILDGTNANWTVVNGTHSFPYGQPCAILEVTIKHPAGSALSNDEEFHFQYTLNMS